MNKSDVTDEWVLKNYDIDKERKEKCKEVCNCDCVLNVGGSWSLERFINNVKSEVSRLIDPKAREYKIEVDAGWDDPGTFEVTNYIYRDETDREVISRLKSRKKKKIDDEEKKRKEKEKELKELERLKNKYE